MITIGLFYCCENIAVYPYEYMDDWEKLNGTSLSEKEDLFSHLNMEDITNADYPDAKRICKDFEIKNLGEYHDLYIQGNTLLLADVFENFKNICLKIYELDPAKFLSDLVTDIDMLLMAGKVIRGGICHSIYRYANNKYMKDYDKIKESSYLKYLDVYNLYGWAMSQKFIEDDS